MKVSKVIIEKRIKRKILDKHNILASEIREILLNNPYILKTRERRYMAIGFSNKFITIIFELEKDTAYVITAYLSSDSQRKLYKRKRR